MTNQSCPRCNGMVVDHRLYEPYCLQCGWINHVAVSTSSVEDETQPRTPEPKGCVVCGGAMDGPRYKVCAHCAQYKRRSRATTWASRPS